MAYPQQNFPNIQDLFNYMNTEWITNGEQLITGVTGNNVVNALANFIIKYTLNSSLVSIVSSGGNVVLPTPMTCFINTTPTAISWGDDVQNEYYIINATASPAPLLSTFAYYDHFLTPQTSIPANTVIHIAKATNGLWLQVNNSVSGGTGGSGIIPITSANFVVGGNPNPTICPIPTLSGKSFQVFWNDINRFILLDTSPPEWGQYAGGGFQVFIPGFDATQNLYHFFLWQQ